jgi:hypothetical protein
VRYNTISAIGDFTALSSASGDYLALDPKRCDGGGDAPLRTTVEPAPGEDGALIFPPLDDAQIITLGGDLIIISAGDESGYFAAIDTLYASLKTALDALKTAPDDLVHSAGSLKVWKYAPIADGWEGTLKQVTFGLAVDVFA